MTTEELTALFHEIATSGVELHGTYNRRSGKDNFKPGTRYTLVYDKIIDKFHVASGTMKDLGYFNVNTVMKWFCNDWWKIDDVFVDEWIERYMIPKTIADHVEELL